MCHLIYQAAYHFRKLKIKEWLFSMTDEMEDPEEETAEVAQKRKRTTKDKRMTALREKKKKEQNFLLFRYLLLLYNLQPRFLKYFQNILSKFNSIFICQIHNNIDLARAKSEAPILINL